MKTLERVTAITSEHLAVPQDKVKPESSFTDDLGADSLDLVELLMAFEEEFDIEISDEEAEKVGTVAEAVSMFDEKRS